MALSSDSQSFRRWECHKGEKRWSTDACLYFSNVYSLPSFFFYYLLFFCSLVLSFCLTLLSILPLSPVHGYLPSLLYCLIQWDFSIFSLRLHQLFLVFFFFGILLGLSTNPLVARPLSLLRTCLLHHSSSPDKIPYFVSPPSQFLSPSMDKD